MRRRTDGEASIVARAAGVEPLEPYPGATRPWRCRCLTCDREVTPSYSSMQQRRGGCRYCAGRLVDSADADLIMAKAGLVPQEPYPGAHEPWSCRCGTCGSSVLPTLSNIKRGQGGCQFCAKNAITATDAVETARSMGVEPIDSYPGARRPWRSRCLACGREVYPHLQSMRQGMSGCGYCAGNRLEPEEAVEVMRAAGLEPLEPYVSSHTPWRCRCLRCERTVEPHYSSVRHMGTACRYCAARGFDYSQEQAVVYLLLHPEFEALKVGISGSIAYGVRREKHTRNGWQVVREFRASPDTARSVELATLLWWRELGAPATLTRADMPQGGFTETASTAFVTTEEATEFISRELGGGAEH